MCPTIRSALTAISALMISARQELAAATLTTPSPAMTAYTATALTPAAGELVQFIPAIPAPALMATATVLSPAMKLPITALLPTRTVLPAMTAYSATAPTPAMDQAALFTPEIHAHFVMSLAAYAMRQLIIVQDVIPILIVTAYAIRKDHLRIAAGRITAPLHPIRAKKIPTRPMETVSGMHVTVKEILIAILMLMDLMHLYSKVISAEALYRSPVPTVHPAMGISTAIGMLTDQMLLYLSRISGATIFKTPAPRAALFVIISRQKN
jgi:hypothetical protein